jgi:hypothetical protein
MRQLLVIAALVATFGCSVFVANAAPVTGMYETLKAGASEASSVQQVRHRRHHRREKCWWSDRWLCSWLW